ncbi:MAG TPA: haloacid dehalogenase type II [Capillimicrobium sp.]|nr:haloacid dehalogenase type II [Capillimicrobium sp.]
MSALDPTAYDVLTFDCYGTIIDWDTGLLGAYRPVLAAHGARDVSDAELLDLYARFERDLEHGPHRRYREVVGGALQRIGQELGASPISDEEADAAGGSVGAWPPFPDSAAALARLQRRYRLIAVTNCDDDLFAGSQDQLGLRFDAIVTAQQVGAYKPDHRMFEAAFARAGVPQERILHVAQSLYHDHEPARALGLTSVWIDRRGEGTTAGTTAAPALVLPDLATLADRLDG